VDDIGEAGPDNVQALRPGKAGLAGRIVRVGQGNLVDPLPAPAIAGGLEICPGAIGK
jgi:hypothetical protein